MGARATVGIGGHMDEVGPLAPEWVLHLAVTSESLDSSRPGFVTRSMVDAHGRGCDALTALLVQDGLWEPVDDGWHVKDVRLLGLLRRNDAAIVAGAAECIARGSHLMSVLGSHCDRCGTDL